MEYLIIASGVALAAGVRVLSLLLEFRGAFPRPKSAEPNPMRPPQPRPGVRGGRHPLSFRP